MQTQAQACDSEAIFSRFGIDFWVLFQWFWRYFGEQKSSWTKNRKKEENMKKNPRVGGTRDGQQGSFWWIRWWIRTARSSTPQPIGWMGGRIVNASRIPPSPFNLENSVNFIETSLQEHWKLEQQWMQNACKSYILEGMKNRVRGAKIEENNAKNAPKEATEQPTFKKK